MELFGITFAGVSGLISLAYWGTFFNIVSYLVIFFYRFYELGKLQKEEFKTFDDFCKRRSKHITLNAIWKNIGTTLLLFVPMYTTVLNIIAIYNLYIYKGYYGLQQSIIEPDNFRLIQITKYSMSQTNNNATEQQNS